MSTTPRPVMIVDYGVGNLFSVVQACRSVGLEARITSQAADLADAPGIILPGVGAFAFAMQKLSTLNMVSALRQQVAAGTPLMGICLGFQLLFEQSSEMGRSEGLGFIAGHVTSLRDRLPLDRSQPTLARLPHVGWARIRPPRQTSNGESFKGVSLQQVPVGSYMYFVHSYFASPAQADDAVASTTVYGQEICCAVERGNIFGCQFHPEKSGRDGIVIYRNFAARLALI
jgi:glutamine amidotransferase